jgi:hypothetical protein
MHPHHISIIDHIVRSKLHPDRNARSLAVLQKFVDSRTSATPRPVSYRLCGQMARLLRRYCSYDELKAEMQANKQHPPPGQSVREWSTNLDEILQIYNDTVKALEWLYRHKHRLPL